MTAQELRRKLERQQKELVKVYNKAYSDLQERLKRQELRGLSTYHTKALLEDVERISAELESYVESWIRNNYPDAYELGSSTAVEKLTKHYKIGGINSSFGGVHQAAIEAIVSDTLSDIASATSYMQDGLKKAIRDAAKQKYPAGLITGDTRKSITKEMVQTLNTKGFTAYYDEKGRYIPLKQYADTLLSENWVGFVDKSGRRWDLLNYSEMLTRTKLAEAVSQGTENRLTQNGLDLVMISAHGAEDWCRFYENKIFSISGRTEGYPRLEDAPNGGTPFHPRCKHFETPFVEKFESDETINYGKQLDDKYKGLNVDGHADQAKLREFEQLQKGKTPKSVSEERKYFQSAGIRNKVQLPGLSEEAQKESMKSFSLALEHGLASGNECLLTLDVKTGKQVYNKIEGDSSGVGFPQQFIDFLQNADDNSVLLIHNHPGSSSFSTDDINVLTLKSVNKLGVVGHDKTLYFVQRNGNSADLSIEKIAYDRKTVYSKHFDYYQGKVLSGEMTPQEAWKEHSHKILQYVAEKNNLDYRRWLPYE